MVMIFDPHGLTLEEYDQLPPDVDLDNIEEVKVPLGRALPVLPSYAPKLTDEGFQKVMSGERPSPTLSIGAGLASIMVASEAVNIILKRRDIVTAPRYVHVDLLDRQSTIGTVL
jgi:hypothetical protein